MPSGQKPWSSVDSRKVGLPLSAILLTPLTFMISIERMPT